MPGKYIGNEWFTERECAIIEILQDALYKLETGQEDKISGASFTFSGPLISDGQVDTIVEAIDAEFIYEMKTYPGYHENHANAKTTPDFHRLSRTARRRLVEALQEAKYTTTSSGATVTPSGLPTTVIDPSAPQQVPEGYYEWC